MIEYKNGQTTTSAVIAADAEIVWDIITDTHLWPQWGPSVSVVECSDRFITAKSQGRLKTAFGFWLQFSISGFEDKHFWNWRVGALEATGHRVRQEEANRSTLTFSIPWWSTPYLFVCNKALHRIDTIAGSYIQTDMHQR